MSPEAIQVKTWWTSLCCVPVEEADEDRPGQEAGDEQGAGGDQLGRHIAEHAVAEPRDDRGQQGQEDDRLDHAITVTPAKARGHGRGSVRYAAWVPAFARNDEGVQHDPHPFIWLMSSTAIVPRPRK